MAVEDPEEEIAREAGQLFRYTAILLRQPEHAKSIRDNI